VTRKNLGEGTTQIEGLDGRIPVDTRTYIEMVDVKKRDNRVIELEL